MAENSVVRGQITDVRLTANSPTKLGISFMPGKGTCKDRIYVRYGDDEYGGINGRDGFRVFDVDRHELRAFANNLLLLADQHDEMVAERAREMITQNLSVLE